MIENKVNAHDDNDSDDEHNETVGLLSSSHSSREGPKPDESLFELQKKNRLRPIEIMEFKTHKKLRFIDKEVVISRIGMLMLFVSVLYVVWWWSGNEAGTELSVERWHKLKINDIKQWCLDPKASCTCANPLGARHRKNYKTWSLAHIGNIKAALNADSVDVVFLGDSITEGWGGTSLGKSVKEKEANAEVFKSLFHLDKGAEFQGLPLGIAGDKTFHLLWRINNGEIPDTLQPSVWWILIGTNDFLKQDHCSPEVVLMGIKRVVEQMRILRPGSTIVINSLLPRSTEELKGKLVDPDHPDQKTVWEGIMEVNRGLRTYSKRYFNVVYFDATDIFVEQSDSHSGIEGMFISKSLMADFLHPTPEGYRQWGESMVDAIHEILDASKSRMGRKPLPHKWHGN